MRAAPFASDEFIVREGKMADNGRLAKMLIKFKVTKKPGHVAGLIHSIVSV
jgi:hypothetical protein